MAVTNNTSFVNASTLLTDWPNLENYSLWIKCAFEIVTFISIVYSIVALLALQRTKTTPETARFLSSALISYDIIAVSCFGVRRFVDNNEWNTMIQVTGVSFCNLAMTTIGLMSLERLLVFYSPYFYLKFVQFARVKKASISIWVFISFLYWFMRIGLCAAKYPPFTYYNVIGDCNQMNFLYYGALIGTVTIMTVLCYVKIFMIIRKEHNQVNALGYVYSKGKTTNLKYLRNYKSTSLVCVYSLTSIASTFMYAVIISFKLDPIPLRLCTDAINTFNCMMDPLVYVLWYKECRMEMLKLFTTFFPTLRPRVEEMRKEIFFIF